MMHRIIDTDFGEVMVYENGDCYIGDCYDNYVGSIYHHDVLNASSRALERKIEAMLKQGNDSEAWNDCEVTLHSTR